MFETQKPYCPDCNDSEGLDRRGFIGTSVSGVVAVERWARSLPLSRHSNPLSLNPNLVRPSQPRH